MKSKHLYLLFALFVFQNSYAELLKGNFELQNSKINYLVTYLVKKADGESTGSKGKGECKESRCNFLVAAPIKSFISKDSNRDLNMLKTTKADKYPLVVAKIFTSSEITNNLLKADVEIEFVGVKYIYKNVLFNCAMKNGVLHVEGKFDLALNQHNVEKPSLLGVDINETVPLTIVADWKQN